MTAAGLDVTQASVDYTDDLDLDHLVGSLCSAIPVQRLPPPKQRAAFAEQVRRAVAPCERVTEPVRVQMLLGRRRQARRPRTVTQSGRGHCAVRSCWVARSSARTTLPCSPR
jgi:hypothetical protein